MRVDFVECIKQSLYIYYLFLDKPVMPQGENNLFIPLTFNFIFYSLYITYLCTTQATRPQCRDSKTLPPETCQSFTLIYYLDRGHIPPLFNDLTAILYQKAEG
jgi:hypothetical protein